MPNLLLLCRLVEELIFVAVALFGPVGNGALHVGACGFPQVLWALEQAILGVALAGACLGHIIFIHSRVVIIYHGTFGQGRRILVMPWRLGVGTLSFWTNLLGLLLLGPGGCLLCRLCAASKLFRGGTTILPEEVGLLEAQSIFALQNQVLGVFLPKRSCFSSCQLQFWLSWLVRSHEASLSSELGASLLSRLFTMRRSPVSCSSTKATGRTEATTGSELVLHWSLVSPWFCLWYSFLAWSCLSCYAVAIDTRARERGATKSLRLWLL